MAQYATNWTPELVRRFNRYDLNHDGIITAEEVLKVEGVRTAGQLPGRPRLRQGGGAAHCGYRAFGGYRAFRGDCCRHGRFWSSGFRTCGH